MNAPFKGTLEEFLASPQSFVPQESWRSTKPLWADGVYGPLLIFALGWQFLDDGSVAFYGLGLTLDNYTSGREIIYAHDSAAKIWLRLDNITWFPSDWQIGKQLVQFSDLLPAILAAQFLLIQLYPGQMHEVWKSWLPEVNVIVR